MGEGGMNTTSPALFRVKDVARILALSEWEVRRLVESGELHRRYIGVGGRYYRVTADSVAAYLESLSEEPA
jgi:excisionase family DNA binding protein